jgi:hypothetical protein
MKRKPTLLTSSLVEFTKREGATLALVLTATELDKPYFKNGYECRQKRDYSSPSGLASYPVMLVLPAPNEIELEGHWPNVVSLIGSEEIKFYDAKVDTWYGIKAISSTVHLVCIIAGRQDVGAFDGIAKYVDRVYRLSAASEYIK